MSQDVRDQLGALRAPTSLSLPPAATLSALGRRRQRHRRALVGVGLLAGAAVALPLLAGLGQTDRLEVPAGPDRSVDAMPALACGVGPLSLVTAEPGAEQADTPEAAGLRRVLAAGLAGMSFPPKDGWVLMARDGDRVSFGHRTGAVGIDEVVTVERRGAVYEFARSGGCNPIGYPDGRQAHYLRSYSVTGSQLRLQWTGGTCIGRELTPEPPPLVKLVETDRVVSVLLVPAAPPLVLSPGPSRSPGSEAALQVQTCAGVGTDEETVVELGAELGARRVEDLSAVPAVVLRPADEIKTEQKAYSVAAEKATNACTRGAADLGGRMNTAYPITAGKVRDALPEAAALWASLDSAAPAGGCLLNAPDGRTWAYVAAPGVQTVVYDKDHDTNGVQVELGAD